MNLPSLSVPAPTRRPHVAVNRRLQLGVTLDNVQITYDFDEDCETAHVRVQRHHLASSVKETMRNETGLWLLLADIDNESQQPKLVQADLNGLEDVGPEAEVVPLVLEAITVFYDSDELTPLHRRTLRAFYRELTYVTATAKLAGV